MFELWVVLAALLLSSAALLLLPGSEGAVRDPTGGLDRLRRLGTGHRTETSDPGVDAALLLDLTAALLSAGVGIEAALKRLATSVPDAEPLGRVHHTLTAGASWSQATSLVAEREQLAAFCEHLGFAYATGAPSAAMLQAAAEQARAQRRQDSERRAEELGVKMILPLGACFLPAFILLGVVPVVLSMLPEVLGAGNV